MSPQAALPEALAAIPGVWRGQRQQALGPTQASGIAALDDALIGGWPRGALTQLVSAAEGLGLALILPSLARLTQAGQQVALIQTPYQLCAPALATQGVVLSRLLWLQPQQPQQALWAFEQLLRSGLYAAVAYWGGALDGTTERRLQLAAEMGQGLAFCCRVGGAAEHSYAATRLAVQAEGQGSAALKVEVLKSRGLRAGRQLRYACPNPLSTTQRLLPPPSALPTQPLLGR